MVGGADLSTSDNDHSFSGNANSERVQSCAPGEYHYISGSNNTKCAYGQLKLVPAEERIRNNGAQRQSGDERRRTDDDGGHLIGARFGGSPNSENLYPQNRELNRWGGYKKLENKWEQELKNGNKVFVHIFVSSSNQRNREDAVYGSYVIEKPNGLKIFETFSFENEDTETQDVWDSVIEHCDTDI